MLTGKGPDTRNWLSRAPVSSSLLLAFSLSSGANGEPVLQKAETFEVPVIIALVVPEQRLGEDRHKK